MTSDSLICKYCGSDGIIRFGSYKGTQLYWCKACERKFKGDDSLFHMKIPASYVADALDEYYKGMSLQDISDHMKQEHGYAPSKSVVYDWINKYTQMAVDHFRHYTPQVGDVWACDETMLDVDNRKVWFWDVIDTKSRFLLASRVSLVRTAQDADLVFQEAIRKAGKRPRQMMTDKLYAYLDGAEMAFGADTEHIQTSPFAGGKDNTSLIERFHNTLKARTKVMRGFRDINTLIEFTDGFLAYYNFLRANEALDGRTPAEVANLKYDVKTWADVARLPITQGYRPAPPKPVAVRLTRKPKRQRRIKRIGSGIIITQTSPQLRQARL